MFRYSPQALATVIICVILVALVSPVPIAYAATGGDESVAAKSDAKLEEPAQAITTPTVPKKGTAISDKAEAAAAKAGSEALQRRAGEQIGDDPKGRAAVLGMFLQEGDNGEIKVVEVGASSPAFDAGASEGDEILSFQGFSADSYRKWIDGMRRLTTDAPAGSMIPVVVLRDGKRTALRIRVPEQSVRPSTGKVLPQRVGPQSQTTTIPVPVPTGSGRVGVGGGDVLIDNTGPFGNFFGDQTASANDRAMAQIFKLNVPPATTRTGTTATAAAPAGGGMRIGLGGFRDDPTGMVVMVDVGALPAGNYTVGISDPSIIGGVTTPGAATPSNPGVQAPSPGLPMPPQVPAPGNDRRIRPNSGAVTPPAGAVPAVPAPAGAGQPQGNLPPTPPQFIPRTVLAQVAPDGQATSTTPATGQTRPLTAPATGQVNPLTAPPTGKVNPSSTTPTGQSSVNNAQREQGNQTDTGSAGGAVPGSSTLNEIGTLTVDQSGTGRMQTTVEGVQVRNVMGQAIVIYAVAVPPQTTLPPNLNPSAGQPTGQNLQNLRDAGSARGSQGAVPATTGGRTPVAAGVIRLISDRRPPATGVDTTGTPAGVSPGIEQPANAAPATGQNPVR